MNNKRILGHPVHTFFNFSELASLADSCMDQISETGAVLMSLTCDNPSSNWSMLNHLGANLNYRSLKVSLDKKNVLGIPVFATLDACHLLKLVRNAFGTLKVFEDINGDKIKWSYIDELLKIQEKEGLHLCNKLRRAHVEWEANKMCTRLAAQLFSNSVANAIDFCRDHLKLEQFIGSEPTAKFIRLMNNMFDVLNSKKKFDLDSKKPLSKENEHDFKLLFKANVDYLLGLKLSSGKKLVDTPRSRAFVGFVSLMKSIEYMFNSYVLTGHLEYLLTFKLSQDHLGLIFYII